MTADPDSPTPEIKLVNERYCSDTSRFKKSYEDDLVKTKSRARDIAIVMGPSGSGKTVFALKELPLLNKTGDKKSQVTVHYNMQECEANDFADFVEEISQQLQTRLKMEISKTSQSKPTISKLNMCVSLVIDEAYILADWIGNFSNLVNIHNVLGKICTHPQLVIVGTGVDKLTRSLSSTTEVKKYRMLPWEMDSVTNVIKSLKSDKEGHEKIKKTILEQPLLQKLTTNARSAFLLVTTLKKYIGWRGHLLHVDSIVEEVAREYIANNGLANLSRPQRRLLAKAVFKSMKKSLLSSEPIFPEPPDDEVLAAQFYGLIDSHVESVKGKNRFLEGNVNSISVTSAITLVLLAMLDVVGKLGRNWSDFEIICAMREIQHLVLTMEDKALKSKGVKLLSLKQPFPAPAATKNFQVPCLGTNVVVVNGMAAPFADVIAPYRVCQCKWKKNCNDPAILDATEFIKMGIVQTVKFQGVSGEKPLQSQEQADLSRALILALEYHGWSSPMKDNTSQETMTTKTQITEKHGAFYPMDQLLPVGDFPSDQPHLISYSYSKETKSLLATCDDSPSEPDTHEATTFSVESTKATREPIVAVFYTNADSFKIISASSHMMLNKTHSHLDHLDHLDPEGYANKDLLEKVQKELQIEFFSGVKLQFIFAGGQAGEVLNEEA